MKRQLLVCRQGCFRHWYGGEGVRHPSIILLMAGKLIDLRAYSSAVIFGNYSSMATTGHNSSSLWSAQADMPDILIPFLTIQNSSVWLRCSTAW